MDAELLPERGNLDAGVRERHPPAQANPIDGEQTPPHVKMDSAALTLLHEVSSRLLSVDNLRPLLQEILDAAVAIVKAEQGTLQLTEGDSLRLVAHHGHRRPFLRFFASAEHRASACGEALKQGQRVIVEDVEHSPLFTGTPSLRVLRDAGVRAVQSTPLRTRQGRVLGILTTQWSHPHVPDEHDLWCLDLLARQAADLIEHKEREEQLRAANESLQAQTEQLRTLNDMFEARQKELEAANEELRVQEEELRSQAEALRESEQRYRTLFETAPDAIVVHREGRFLDVNEAARLLIGASDAEGLGGHMVLDFFRPEDREETAQRVRRAMRGRRLPVREATIRRLDGQEIVVEFRAAPMDFQGGPAVQTIIRDITEHKRAEEAIRQSQKTFAELIERAPFGIYVVDAQFRVAHMNRSSQNGAFRNVRPVIGRDFAEAMHILWPDEVAAQIVGWFRHTLETGEPYYSPRFTNPRADVAITESYEWELHRMTLPDGQYGAICYYYDSTKLREAQAAVRESEFHLARAQEIARLGSWSWDIAADRLHWSDETYRLFGLQPGESAARNEDFLGFVRLEDRPRVEKAVHAALAHEPYNLDFRIVQRGDEERHVHSEGQTTFDAEGHPVRMEGTVQDITERKRAEEALRESEERLRAAIAGSQGAEWQTAADEGQGHGFGEAADLSPQCKRFIGFADDEFPNSVSAWRQRIHPDDLPAITTAARAHIEARTPFYHVEYRIRHKDGSWRYLFSTGRLQRDADGRALRWIGLDWDVTERKQGEEALRENAERLRSLAENVPCVLMRFDRQFRIVYLNQQSDRYNPNPVERMIGRTNREVGMPPHLCDRWDAALERVFRTGDQEEMEFDFAGPSGMRTFALKFAPEFGPDHEIRYVLGLSSDITDRKQAEEGLRESEERFRALVTASSEVLYRMSPDWGEMRQLHSRGFLANTEAPKRTWFQEYIPPDDQSRVAGAIQKAIRTKSAFELEHRVRRADGSVGWTLSRAIPLLDANGAIREWFGAATDVTDRKQAEEALRESEERFRRYFELGLIGMAITSPAKGWIEVNNECCRLLGYERHELARKTWAQLTYPDDLAADVAQFDRVLAGQIEGYTMDKRFVRKDGQVMDTTMSAAAMRGADGKVDHFLVLLQDITERKRAEEALRELNATLESKVAQRTAEVEQERRRLYEVLESIPAMVCLLTPDYHVAFANRSFREKFGEANGRHCYEFCYGRTEPCEFCETYDVLKTGKSHRWEVTSADGRTIIDAHDFPFTDVDGSPLILEMDTDITERKRAEAELRGLNESLSHRARQLQKLTLELTQAEERERRRIATILHEDLQQQLAGAKLQLSLVRNRSRDDQQRADVDRISEMLKEAIEESRSLSHDLSPAVLHMNDLAEALRWLAARIRAQHGLSVQVDALNEITLQSEALTIFLFRAGQELLFNVVKHAQVKEAVVRIRRTGRYVSLSVCDRGRGFDPQGLKETSGFGLLSLRERTELLGGRLRIKSAPGRGSRVRLMVPDGLEPQGAGKQATGTAGLPTSSSVPDSPSSAGVLRILLVDDHEIVRQGLMSLLQELSDLMVVGEAANGRDAVTMACELRPDVVVMDVYMPLMSGEEATRLIKMHLPRTRVIALSMHEEPDKMAMMYEAGAESYVLKTASSEELCAAIRGRVGAAGEGPTSPVVP